MLSYLIYSLLIIKKLRILFISYSKLNLFIFLKMIYFDLELKTTTARTEFWNVCILIPIRKWLFNINIFIL